MLLLLLPATHKMGEASFMVVREEEEEEEKEGYAMEAAAAAVTRGKLGGSRQGCGKFVTDFL